MKFARIFASAFVRKVAYTCAAFVIAALLSLCGVSKAHAQSYTTPQAAMAACKTGEANAIAANPNHRRKGSGCIVYPATATPSKFQCYYSSRFGSSDPWMEDYGSCGTYHFPVCVAPQVFNPATNTCGLSCSARPSETTPRLPLSGSQQCINGCMVTYMLNGDDETSTRTPSGATCTNTKDNCPVGTFYNVMMNVCQPVVPTCQEGESVKNGVCEKDHVCPDGMVAVQGNTPGSVAVGELFCKMANDTCPHGFVAGPVGECVKKPNTCQIMEALGKDGTCKPDKDGDGVADDEDADDTNDTDKESFSGGDTCDAPPACAGGSPIMCGQARIQWRIDCNTRSKTNISGGSCDVVPLCQGDCKAMEYSQLLMQWRTACAVEKLAKAGNSGTDPGGETGTPGTADYEIQDATETAAGADGDRGTDGDGPDGIFTDESKNNDGAGGAPGSTGELDDEGFGYSRGCPVIPPVNVFGTSVQFNIQPLCDWVSLGGMLVLLFSALLSLRIMSSSTQV